jgi:hypothetical protein
MLDTSSDRRGSGRYELRLPLHYRVSVKGQAVRTGSGATCDMSASGLSFRCRRSLPVGAHIEIMIEWPAKYRGMDALSLQVTGFLVRCDGNRSAVRMTSHKFKVTMSQLESRATA